MTDGEHRVRAGRGSELQFFLTDIELEEAFVEVLAQATGMFLLLGELATGRHEVVNRAPSILSCPPEHVIDCTSKAAGNTVWVYSKAIGGVDLMSGAQRLSDEWTLGGLPLLQHGFRLRGRREASRIAIAGPVARPGVPAAENAEYRQLYRRLRKVIAARLRWSTIRTLADGTDMEDDRLQRMSDGAAEASRHDPTRWAVQPGRDLRA